HSIINKCSETSSGFPMAVEKLQVEAFLQLAQQFPVLDVRSPGEYIHAQIPGAYSLPLFSNEERAVVGTAYKNQGRETAIKIGLDYFGPKMRSMVEEVEKIVADHNPGINHSQNNGKPQSKTVLVHCWRGGMRSSGVAWLLGLYGFKVYTLHGGYKFFRRWVLEKFNQNFSFKILGGYTGSGKTELIHELNARGEKIVDLEFLARHRGSAFGDMEFEKQPSQEMFENRVAVALSVSGEHWENNMQSGEKEIWLEDESQRIGKVNIPNAMWATMRNAPVYFVEIPFEERLKKIVRDYGTMDKERLGDAIIRIQKRLGGLETKMAIEFLQNNNIEESFRILLRYYDKAYSKSLNKRKDLESLLTKIPGEIINSKDNATRILKSKIPKVI
ncbi:MAG: tRNA 2-selenouridine(34) synthase MnmH, partial [Bacteroidetes bacterium]